MAFGDSMDQEQTTTSNEKRVFEPTKIDLKTPGLRVFRLLPEINEDGTLNVDGKGGDRGTTANETRWVEFWWKVRYGDQNIDRPLFVENKWKNPIWDKIQKLYAKEDKSKPTPRERFAINVFDKTPVITLDDGTIVYPNEAWEYIHKGKKVVGTPKPINEIRILDGSAGDKGGEHMLQQIRNLFGSHFHPNDPTKPLYLHEFDCLLKIFNTGKKQQFKGKEFEKITRSFQIKLDYTQLTPEQIALPRFNLDEWARPYPNEMLQRVLDGEDFKELAKEYKIMLFPRKTNEPNPYDTTVDEDELFD